VHPLRLAILPQRLVLVELVRRRTPGVGRSRAAKQAEVEAAVRDLLALQGIQAPALTP
jgi:hypothetical protein